MIIAPSIFGPPTDAMARTAASDEAEPLTGDRVGEYLQQLLRTGSGNVPKIRIGLRMFTWLWINTY